MAGTALVSTAGLSKTILLSVAARELIRQHPARAPVRVYSKYPALFANSTHIHEHRSPEEAPRSAIRFNFDAGPECHQLVGVLDELDFALQSETRLTEFRPTVHLTSEMRTRVPSRTGQLAGQPYWVFSTGGGYDDTTGWWDRRRWQELVSRLAQLDDFPVLAHVGAEEDVYRCLDLRDCVDLFGRTTLLELIWLVYHSRGVLTVGSFLSHLAAALGKPCVVLAGGRVSRWHQGYTPDVIEAYRQVEGQPADGYRDTVPQEFLDVVGTLACCESDACGCTGLGERGTTGKCSDVVVRSHYARGRIQRAARCMAELDVEEAVRCARWADLQNRAG